MAYKIMGVTAGRKNSNSEILLKEALMACEELGAEVRMINLKDFHIEPCTGCTSCTRGMAQGKNTGCVLDKKDDKKKIMDVLLNQDAVIYSAPTYDLMPNAEYLAFAQRSLAFETSFLETIGAIEHRDRVAGLIAVGGSTRAWQSIALECMQATMFTTDFKVVDMILGTRIPGRAQCLLNDELVARAHKMGENIMKAVATPPEERTWLGEEDMGWCPNCHSNALVLGEMQWDGIYYPVLWKRQRMASGNSSSRRTATTKTAPPSLAAPVIWKKLVRPRADSMPIPNSRRSLPKRSVNTRQNNSRVWNKEAAL